MKWNIPLSDLSFDAEEALAVQKVIESRWLTMGAVTQEFERAFEEFIHVNHAVAVTNGTAALHLACLAAGLGPGDEVIVPSLTFVATANAIRYTGATPVFADIESFSDLDISPTEIKQRITDRTKAVMVMHYAGYPCDMDAIMDLAKKHNLKVIEDAAHAVGSTLDGRNMGCVGDVGCFSFFSNKNMTTGEGGMVVTNDDAIAEKLRLMRSHGMTTMTWDRHRGHAQGYDVVEVGYNYRIDEIRSAMGLVQLRKLSENNKRRQDITRMYWAAIHELTPEIGTPFKDHRGSSAAHIMPVLLPEGMERMPVMEELKSQGIQTSNHYPPIHSFSIYKSGDAIHLPKTEQAAEREITLPLYPAMTREEVLTVVKALQSALAKK